MYVINSFVDRAFTVSQAGTVLDTGNAVVNGTDAVSPLLELVFSWGKKQKKSKRKYERDHLR